MIIKKNTSRNIIFCPPAGSRGFSLVETMVALAILLVAVVAPISLIGDSLHKIYYAKDEIIAISLAQEGIEMVRQARDTNMLTGIPWGTSLSPGEYTIDVSGLTEGKPVNKYVIPCPSCAGIPQAVYLDSETGLYRQNSIATQTQFSRIVTIDSTGLPADERKITAQVVWNTGGTTGSILVSEYIFNWAF